MSKFSYVKYSTHRGHYAALAFKGRTQYSLVWLGNGFPVSLLKVPFSEAKYFYTLGTLEEGVASWAKKSRTLPWTKEALTLFKRAQKEVK